MVTSTLDALALGRAMEVFAEALQVHRDEIDSLNVFPVPDGDTGTNMLLTQQAVVAAIHGLDESREPPILLEAISRASLMGARGNSGVILSQVLRGLSERVLTEQPATPIVLAEAFQHASEEANRAVLRPVQGTILSVMRDAARASRLAAGEGADCLGVAEAALRAARASLMATRNALPELRSAGVVDAGAAGAVLLFAALRSVLADEPVDEPVGPFGPVGRAPAAPAGARQPEFEVQFLLESNEHAAAEIRRRLANVGNSVAMVGGGGLFNLHVHTDSPDAAIEIGNEGGRLRDVRVASLAQEAPACGGNLAREVQVGEEVCGLVAVVDGAGLLAAFRSLGASVVPGSARRPPGIAELLIALEAAHPKVVAVVPNDPELMMLADAVAVRSAREVSVVPAVSIPAGLSAATAFNPSLPLAENVALMRTAAEACRTAQLTVARHPVDLSVGGVEGGDWTGMVAGRVVAAGHLIAEVATKVVELIADGKAEMLTLVVGEGVAPGDGAVVIDALTRTRPDLELEVIDGGHPEYPLLIGAE